MRILGTALVVGTVVALTTSPTLRHDAAATIHRMVADQPDTHTRPKDQHTYDRLCPALAAWSNMDTHNRATATRALTRIAARQSHRTEDPALRAFLHVVPTALDHGTGVQTRAAKALIARECSAHGH